MRHDCEARVLVVLRELLLAAGQGFRAGAGDVCGMAGMSEQPKRTVALEQDRDRIHDWLVQVGAHAAREVNAAVRCIEDIRRWAAHEQHLIDTCATADCADCAARESLLNSLGSLLPDVSRTSGEPAGEVTPRGERDASDVPRRRGRPGVVTTPDP